MQDLRRLHVALCLIMHHRGAIVKANGLDARVFRDWVREIDIALGKVPPDTDRIQYLLVVIGCWISVVPELEDIRSIVQDLVAKRGPLELCPEAN